MLRKILLIAKRDYIASVLSRAFLVGLVLTPLLTGGGFLGLALLRVTQPNKENHVALIDRTGIAAAAVVDVAQTFRPPADPTKAGASLTGARYVFDVLPAEADADAQRLALAGRVRNGELAYFVDVPADALESGKVTMFAQGNGIDDSRGWLAEAVTTGLRRVRLERLGVDGKQVREVLRPVIIDRLGLPSLDPHTGSIQKAQPRNEVAALTVPAITLVLMMMIVMGSAGPMLSAIAEDKMQRVFEMLLVSVTPFELMFGKVLASVGRALTSSLFYMLGGLLGLQGAALLGLVPFEILPWFLAFIVAEVTMLSALAAALGAACATPRDAQQFAMVLLIPLLIPLFLLLPLTQRPNGTLAVAMSFTPPFTPMVMMLRQSMPGGVPAWEPWVGLAGTVLFAVAVTWVAGRIFRVALLMQGKTPLLSDLARWAVRG